MANISEFLQKIKEARYGRDVRSSIHDGIKAINEEMEGVNFTLAKQLQDEGINIFNSSEPFFNDKCISYSLDGKDLTVKDRREKILQNIPLCEEGCQVQNINYTLSSIDCECTPKKEGFNSVIESNEIISTLTDLINNYNFYILWTSNIC